MRGPALGEAVGGLGRSSFLRLLLALAACLHAPSVLAIESFDTGLSAKNVAFWLDDNRVLFPGFTPASAGEEKKHARKPVLYVWDERSRTARIHTDIAEGSYVCSVDGYVSYMVRKDGVQYLREGKLGEERERRWIPPTALRKVDINDITCKEFDFGAADKIYPEFLFIPLRDGDGYYGWNREESRLGVASKPVYYLAAGPQRRPVRLPVEGNDLVRVFYSPYFKGYAFECLPSRRDDSTVGDVWVVGLDGGIKKFTVPAGPWMGATVWMVPARSGVVMSSLASGLGKRKPGAAGVYLVRDGRVKRLLEGFPAQPAVSPDGCKVAVVVGPVDGARIPATLRILTLCRP